MTNPAERILYGDEQPDGNVPYWLAPTLWAAAKGKPQIMLPIGDLEILDAVVWFGGPKNVEPTIRRVAERARDIMRADLSFPIIMLASGDIVDGAHRIAKAYLEGLPSISAVVVGEMPAPDGFVRAET